MEKFPSKGMKFDSASAWTWSRMGNIDGVGERGLMPLSIFLLKLTLKTLFWK